jgi:hypothetical protein
VKLLSLQTFFSMSKQRIIPNSAGITGTQLNIQDQLLSNNPATADLIPFIPVKISQTDTNVNPYHPTPLTNEVKALLNN